MHRPRIVSAISAGILTIASITTSHAQVTAEAVQRSIDRGVRFLRQQQAEDGSWPEFVNHNCGLTALCTLALMNCGYDHTDPSIDRALRYLRTKEARDTYSVALQTMVLCQAKQARDLSIIRTNVKWLEEAQVPAGGGRAGAWTYERSRSAGDPSNTQFALLALSAAEDRGIPVRDDVFELAEQYWRARQQQGGGWAYSQNAAGGFSTASGSMTCAGIASLVITRGHTGFGQARIEGGRIRCCGADEQERDPIASGLQWLGKNFLVQNNPGIGNNTLYYLYALERVGRLTGQRLIGQRDWYREGADYLLRIQDDFDGSWVGASPGEKRRTIATSFALLFLSKGKRRVVISRLQHGMADDWNWHPDALRQLTRHVERRWEQDLTWQQVRLGGAKVEDLLSAPVLFISGSGPLVTTEKEREVLKQYIEQGGFIFAQATSGTGCPDGRAFEQSIRSFAEQTFDGSLEKLPANHPIWFAEYPLQPTKLPPNFWLYGVQACCRTSIVYSPVSLACLWELSDPSGRKELPEQWEPTIDMAAKIGQNVIAYATGRNLNDKLDAPSVIRPQRGDDKIARGTIAIPRLLIGAGGEEAPRALPNLMEWMRRHVEARITSQSLTTELDPEALESYPIVFLHGRYEFTFSEQQRTILREYLDNGGMILATSICGSEAFTQAFRREMQSLLPDSPLAPLPASHEAFTSRYRGYNLSNISLHQPGSGNSGIPVRKLAAPLIEVIRRDDRACVFFSPYDLSCALENQGGIQCLGYQTEDAAKIGINLILYCLTQ